MPTGFTDPPTPHRSPLGQDTGGDEERKQEEARKLLGMMVGVHITPVLTPWEGSFLTDAREKLEMGRSFSGKEVFKLRELKDKLVEKGLL